MSILDRLIERAGGWENYLYQTLRRVYSCSININNSPNLQEALEEAKDVLDLYEEHVAGGVKEVQKAPFTTTRFPGKEHLSNVSQDPIVVESSKVVDESRTEAKSTPPLESNGREEITRVTVLLPAKESKSQPQELRGVASIDPTIGDCQGVLPIPEGCQIVNRDKVRITTRTGAELGRAQTDGQVKGSENVTGRIRTDGRFDLVFKDTKLGEAVIWYEVVGEKKLEERELKMISFLDANSKKWISFIEGSEVEVKADTIKESKGRLLDILSKEIGMQIISAVVLKKSEDNTEEVKRPPHIILQPGG